MIFTHSYIFTRMKFSAALANNNIACLHHFSAKTLYAKHWLNSIGTGAAFALLVWGPWALQNHAIMINRFLAAGIWMVVMMFPIFAAKWTIGPHKELPRPTA